MYLNKNKGAKIMNTIELNEKKTTGKADMYQEMYVSMFKQANHTISILEEICKMSDDMNAKMDNISSADVKEFVAKIRHYADNEVISLKLSQQKSEKIYINYFEKPIC